MAALKSTARAARTQLLHQLPTDLGLDQDRPCQGRAPSLAHSVPKTPLLSRGPGCLWDPGLPRSQLAPFTYFSWRGCGLAALAPWPQREVVPRSGAAGSRVGGEALSAEPQPAALHPALPQCFWAGGFKLAPHRWPSDNPPTPPHSTPPGVQRVG